jgi:hypothetical protein
LRVDVGGFADVEDHGHPRVGKAEGHGLGLAELGPVALPRLRRRRIEVGELDEEENR